jgi:hypothetical protein
LVLILINVFLVWIVQKLFTPLKKFVLKIVLTDIEKLKMNVLDVNKIVKFVMRTIVLSVGRDIFINP